MKDTDGTLLVNSEPMSLQTAHRFIQSTLTASPKSIVIGENYSVGPLQTSNVRSHSEYAVFDFRGDVVERGFDPVKLYRMFSSDILDSGFTRLSSEEPTMRRTASEVLHDLETRVARLEKDAGLWSVIKTNIFFTLQEWTPAKIKQFLLDYAEHIEEKIPGAKSVVANTKTAQYNFEYQNLNLTCTAQVDIGKKLGFATSSVKVQLYLQSAEGEHTEIQYGNGGLTTPILVSYYEPGFKGEFHVIEKDLDGLESLSNKEVEEVVERKRLRTEENERRRLENLEKKRLRTEEYERNRLRNLENRGQA